MKQHISFYKGFFQITAAVVLLAGYGCSSAATPAGPTPNPEAIFTKAAQTATTRLTQTEMVVTREAPLDTATPETTDTSTTASPQTPAAVTSTVEPASALTAPSAPTTAATPVAPKTDGAACIPANPPQTGKVLDILDGDTIKVMIDGKTFTVRYIGIDAPEYVKTKDFYSIEARNANSKLVFAKDITLIKDNSDTDASGRLLRYVKIGDTFVNLELVVKGFARAVSSPPDSACDAALKSAQDQASSAKVGLWSK
jgi:micrococcal nuclease